MAADTIRFIVTVAIVVYKGLIPVVGRMLTLKRLKQIIDRLNKGEELFIILDEILKGTNSMDKQKGSFALVRQLMELKTNGIIATHDLLLGKLIEYFPKEIRNYCFEADITNDELTFSYKLREGIAQNMNACFLMKKMGLIIND